MSYSGMVCCPARLHSALYGPTCRQLGYAQKIKSHRSIQLNQLALSRSTDGLSATGAEAIDGAGPWQLFFHIYLPLILLAMVAMGNFLATDDAPWNLLMAESVLYSVPPVILYYCFLRHLLSGLVTGAVK